MPRWHVNDEAHPPTLYGHVKLLQSGGVFSDVLNFSCFCFFMLMCALWRMSQHLDRPSSKSPRTSSVQVLERHGLGQCKLNSKHLGCSVGTGTFSL